MIRLGFKGKLFYGPAGTQAGTELTAVRSVKFSIDRKTADASSRASNGWSSIKGCLKSLKIDFDLVNRKDDLGVAAFKAAAISEEGRIAVWCRDAVDGEGPDADFIVTKFERDESLEGVQSYSVSLEANDDDRAPTWS